MLLVPTTSTTLQTHVDRRRRLYNVRINPQCRRRCASNAGDVESPPIPNRTSGSVAHCLYTPQGAGRVCVSENKRWQTSAEWNDTRVLSAIEVSKDQHDAVRAHKLMSST
jgi:hypothetical protein